MSIICGLWYWNKKHLTSDTGVDFMFRRCSILEFNSESEGKVYFSEWMRKMSIVLHLFFGVSDSLRGVNSIPSTKSFILNCPQQAGFKWSLTLALAAFRICWMFYSERALPCSPLEWNEENHGGSKMVNCWKDFRWVDNKECDEKMPGDNHFASA